MEERQAIRLEGQKAEDAFLKLVPGSKPSDVAKRGDAIVTVDGIDHYVEIKECHNRRGGTINQVRPIKFITCVVWAPNQNRWYILSPDQLVLLAATKSRGQHTEIPFESMSFGLGSLLENFHSKATNDELAAKVQAAVRRGANTEGLSNLMSSLMEDIISIKEKYIEAVNRADDET